MGTAERTAATAVAEPSAPPLPAGAPPPGLRARTYRSAGWTVLRMAALNLLQVVQVAALARILEPADFGQVSLVVAVLALTEVFTKTGIEEALIRHRGDIAPFLDSAWSLQAVRGLLQAAVVLLAGPVLAVVWGSWSLLRLSALAALVPALDGLRSLSPIVLTRELAMGRLVLAEAGAGLISVGTAVLLATTLRSPWAIVINMVLFTVLKNLGFYLIHPYRPRPTRRWTALRPFFGFGVFFNLATCAMYVAGNLDKLILGRLLGLHALGLYDRASMLSSAVKAQLVRLLGAVVFPSFSHLQGSPERFHAASRKFLVILGVAVVAFPLALLPFSRPIVRVLLGARFEDSAPLFAVLLFSTTFHGFALGLQTLLNTLGRPRYTFYANLAQIAGLLIALPLGIATLGMQGACIGVVTADACCLAATVVFALRGKIRAEEPAAPVASSPS